MNLEFSFEYDLWNKSEVESITKQCIESVFNELKLKSDNIEICLLFTSDEEVRILNKTFRGIDKPTNVLSFPAESIEKDDDNFATPCILGSVAIAYETLKRESEEQNKKFEHHLSHLIIHSVLHLLGYDHIDKDKVIEMEQLEVKILSSIGIPDPYQFNSEEQENVYKVS